MISSDRANTLLNAKQRVTVFVKASVDALYQRYCTFLRATRSTLKHPFSETAVSGLWLPMLATAVDISQRMGHECELRSEYPMDCTFASGKIDYVVRQNGRLICLFEIKKETIDLRNQKPMGQAVTELFAASALGAVSPVYNILLSARSGVLLRLKANQISVYSGELPKFDEHPTPLQIERFLILFVNTICLSCDVGGSSSPSSTHSRAPALQAPSGSQSTSSLSDSAVTSASSLSRIDSTITPSPSPSMLSSLSRSSSTSADVSPPECTF